MGKLRGSSKASLGFAGALFLGSFLILFKDEVSYQDFVNAATTLGGFVVVWMVLVRVGGGALERLFVPKDQRRR